MNWRDLFPDPQQRALYLIRAAAWLAPPAVRAEWRQEWISELHFALRTMRERGDGAAAPKLIEFARGAFHDAAWHRAGQWNRERVERAISRGTRSAGFCLATLAALVALIAIASGFLPETRAVLLPLPYTDAGRIAAVTQGGTRLAVRSGIHREWVRWWRADSHLIDGAATYLWTEQSVNGARTLRAIVSDDFFSLLGARWSDGQPIARNAFLECRGCAVLSYDFSRRNYPGKLPATVTIDGTRFRVAGVLDRGFWFLTRRIGVWTSESQAAKPDLKTGVVLRLRQDVSKAQVEAELESIVQKRGINPWSSLIAISPLAERVRSVFGSFALALLLAMVTILPALRPKLKGFHEITWHTAMRAMYFCAKTALLLIAVLLAGLEFTRAASITMLGGTDLLIEPLSTWLFLLGCMGALSWSIYDQRRRCRVCLGRYGLAVPVGCPGCILLSWAGTELVCLEGHGTLHVSGRVTSWQEQDRWTSLDDSVLEFFAKCE